MVGKSRAGWWLIRNIVTDFGGSSKSFNSAFAAAGFISSTASMIATRRPPSAADRVKKLFIFRTSSTEITSCNLAFFSS